MYANLQQIVIRMSKLAIYVMIVCQTFSMAMATETAAQRQYLEEIEVNISESVHSRPLLTLIQEIESVSNFKFAYSKNEMKNRQVDISGGSWNMRALLKEISSQSKLSIQRVNESIALVVAEQSEALPSVVENVTLQIGITGTISDENGESLPGATIQEKGTTNGTITDAFGKYSLNVSESAILTISFVGYETSEVQVNSRSVIDVQLEANISALEEVVVVGYGTQKKVNLTGAVESVDEDDIVSRPVGQASMALQGLAPGVTVTQSSGKPGSDAGQIRIRGIGTIGDSNPLVLVDGVPFNLNDVDVNEIASISVLKDASSASIYGSRAANGVILVTTKRAKKEQFSVSYRANAGWQEPTELMQKVSGYDHMVMINEASSNVGLPEPFSQTYIDEYRAQAPSDEYPETNWHDEMVREKAFQQSHYLNINSGGERISLLGSVSFMDQWGLLDSHYKRLNVRLNTDVRLMDNLRFNVDVFSKNEGNEEPPQHWHWLARYPHNLAGKNEDGSWGVGWDGQNGWGDMEDGGTSSSVTDELLLNVKMDWQPFEGFNVNLQVAPNKSYNHYKNFDKYVPFYYPDGFIINPSPYKASLTEQYRKAVTNNYRALLTYDKSIGKSTFGLLAGWEAIDYKNEYIRGFRDQYPLENYEVLDVGSTANQTATGSAYEWALMSYFARVNYNFDEKYLLEFNSRIDGSSRFAEGYKYGFFPSVSGGWRISEESFMAGVPGWLYDLKLRASWGMLGNQSIGNYPFTSGINTGLNYVFGNDNPGLGAALINASNPQISWETTEMTNVGIDAGIGNFILTADYYIKNTNDILLRLPVPQVAGLAAPYQNAGSVRNNGWDLRVQYGNEIGDFNFNIGANLSDVKNEIVDLVGTGPYIHERTVQMEGQPIDALFGLQSSGLFQNQTEIDNHASQFGTMSPGDIRYVDQSVDLDGDGVLDAPDGVVNANDRVVMGSTIPRYTFGLNLSFDYKGFDFGTLLQGVGKVDGYLDNFATMAFYLGGTAQEWHKDHWTAENPNASYPRLTFNFPNNEQVSSYWIRSAAYLRMKNLQVGYTLPSSVTDKVGLDKLRVFFQGQNLFTLDKFYDSYDPEAPVGQGTFYPMVKVFVFGIDTTF